MRRMATSSPLRVVCISTSQELLATLATSLIPLVETLAIEPCESIEDLDVANFPDLIIFDGREGSNADRALHDDVPTILITKRRAHPRVDRHEAGPLLATCVAEDITSPHFASLVHQLLLRHRLTNQLAHANARLHEQSMRDDLTGVYNKVTFEELFAQTVKEANRYKTPLALLLLDLDGFRSYVADHGYQSGEQAIRAISSVLQQCIRESDLPARWRQDAFIVALPETDIEEAQILADRVRRALRHAQRVQTDLAWPTVSIGISELRLARRSARQLQDTTEKALVLAKENGGDQVVAWHQDRVHNAEGEAQFCRERTTALRTAIKAFSAEARQHYFDQLQDFFKTNPTYQQQVMPHASRVATLADRLATQLGWRDHDRHVLQRAAWLHDIGLSVFSETLLAKRTSFDGAEEELIRQHPLIGVQLLDPATFIREEIAMILHHHEHFDGNGYPDHLAGHHIPMGARIIAIAEAWDSMTVAQPYRDALPTIDAAAELQRCAGTQFDPALTQTFLQMVG